MLRPRKKDFLKEIRTEGESWIRFETDKRNAYMLSHTNNLMRITPSELEAERQLIHEAVKLNYLECCIFMNSRG